MKTALYTHIPLYVCVCVCLCVSVCVCATVCACVVLVCGPANNSWYVVTSLVAFVIIAHAHLYYY